MPVDYKLPIRFFRVGGTSFTDAQIKAMVARTNTKMASVGIEIEIDSIANVANKTQAYVSLGSREKELENLLANNGFQGGIKDKTLRVFLVKLDIDEYNASWTYDPYSTPDFQSAIFITELFNDNSDEAYEAQLYKKENDTLLHELGHCLMWEAIHEGGAAPNFFHYLPDLTDDTITAEQRVRMRGEDSGRPADAPNYLRII